MAGLNIKIADLRTRVTFQQPTTTKDVGGAQVQGFANVATNPTVWARWINAHGQEAEQSEALKSVQRATVTVRYRSDILPTWQLLKDDEAWQIISVDPVRDRNRWIEMIVERAKGSS
jgi:SPP1 family predicted phage head-tail adaptor